MAILNIFQEALTAPTSTRDVGQEMLHAILLLSCAFVGWCASSAMLNVVWWSQNRSSQGKGKQGSDLFREEVAAYVQVNSIQGAIKHFGLSRAEIQNCVDASERSQPQEEDPAEEESDDEDEYESLNFSTAPSLSPGMMLLEHYGAFGASSGMWSGPVVYQLPEYRDDCEKEVPKHAEDDAQSTTIEEESAEEQPEEDVVDTVHDGEEDPQATVWVPLEYQW